MMRRLMILATSAILFLGATEPGVPAARFVRGGVTLLAHERFRIVGTVTKRTDKQIEVRNKDGKTLPIDVDRETRILRDKKKVPSTALKVGITVVVDAIGDDDADLVAEQVRIVPAIPAPPAKTPRRRG